MRIKVIYWRTLPVSSISAREESTGWSYQGTNRWLTSRYAGRPGIRSHIGDPNLLLLVMRSSRENAVVTYFGIGHVQAYLELPDLNTLHQTRWCCLLTKNSQGYGLCRASSPGWSRPWSRHASRICVERRLISSSTASATALLVTSSVDPFKGCTEMINFDEIFLL